MKGDFATLLRSSHRALLGTWVKMPTTTSVELLALAGFDFLVIDMEHAPLGVQTVHELIGAAAGYRVPALVRVPDQTGSPIGRVLDSGAAGVLVPHIDSAAEAEAVVGAARFPPRGTRGFGPTVRAGGWGADVDRYMASSDGAFVAPQLESRVAVDAAGAIGAVNGLGALFVGPVDLAVSCGLDLQSREVADLIEAIKAAAGLSGVPIGTAIGADPAAAREMAQHYDFLVVGNDASLLRGAATGLIDAVRHPASARLGA